MSFLKKTNLLCLFLILIFLNLTLLATRDDCFNEDMGRHLTLGKIIAQTRQIPQNNLFSFTEPEHPFINHHWLSQVIFWQIYQSFSFNGLLMLKVFLINNTIVLLYLATTRKGKLTEFLVLPFFALAILILKDRFDLRPELFSYLLITVFIYLLQKPLTYKRALMLFFLQVLWVNLHIYFFLGPLLVFTFSLEKFLKTRKWLKPALTTGSVIAACLVNPYFLLGTIQPLLIFKQYGYSVTENKSIFYLEWYFQTTGFFLHKIFLALTFLSALISLKRKDLTGATLQTIAFLLALTMVRNFPLLPILTLPALARNLHWLQRLYFDKTIFQKTNIKYLSQFAFLIMALASFLTAKTFLAQPHFYIKYAALGDFLQKHEIKGNIFNNYDPGSYLIFKLHPQHQVFVDNRPEAYSVDFFQKIYIPMQQSLDVFKQYEEAYAIKTIIWSKTDYANWSYDFLGKILPQLQGWEKIYEDDVSLVYEKVEE